MVTFSVVLGDITQQSVDAVVNAADTRMRSGGRAYDWPLHDAAATAVKTIAAANTFVQEALLAGGDQRCPEQ